MGRRNTAIKGCHRCKKLVPTATRYCRCGYDFKKPNPDKAATSAPRPPPKASTATAAAVDSSRRKSERRQRITVKPNFYSPSDYENPFKKVRRRTASDTSISDEGARKKRGRPKERLATSFVKPSIKALSQAPAAASTESPGTPNPDSKDSNGSKRDREQEVDMHTSLPPEKQLQYKVLLAEINRKFSGQIFRPT